MPTIGYVTNTYNTLQLCDTGRCGRKLYRHHIDMVKISMQFQNTKDALSNDSANKGEEVTVTPRFQLDFKIASVYDAIYPGVLSPSSSLSYYF